MNFAENVLKPDGILLLSFVSNRANGLIASDLTREIWFSVGGCDRFVFFAFSVYYSLFTSNT